MTAHGIELTMDGGKVKLSMTVEIADEVHSG
jgi:hypothetical protein